MITRLVKMTFREEEINAFRELFNEVKDQIMNFPGCRGVELSQDIHDPRIFFTISLWEKEHDLQNYRLSALFSETWIKTKAKFAARPEAWSTEILK
jgi:autoinducer 2-degrading protein